MAVILRKIIIIELIIMNLIRKAGLYNSFAIMFADWAQLKRN